MGHHSKRAYRLVLEARQEGSSSTGRCRDELLLLYAEIVPRAKQEIAEYLNRASIHYAS